MQYLWQHISHLLSVYDGKLPLHHYLRGYFKTHPKLGSRDRKAISQAVYSWYRAGKIFLDDGRHGFEERVLAAMCLCGGAPKILTGPHREFYWLYPGSPAGATRELRRAGHTMILPNIFPYDFEFSEGTNRADWARLMLGQPRLFLRIRKNRQAVAAAIEKAGISQEWLSETCLALPNGTKVETLLLAEDYVVQDASSQATGSYLKGRRGEQWWDCCAGAGGKSLMLTDQAQGIQLLATDVRGSILQNLAARFKQYHVPVPQCRVLNAADAPGVARMHRQRKFDGIICDVPCSGSGTWARTPESCYFFRPETLTDYTQRQQAILSNASNYIGADGRIYYITCSVFRAENEDIINTVSAEKGLAIESSDLINGTAIGADSLFIAVLRKA